MHWEWENAFYSLALPLVELFRVVHLRKQVPGRWVPRLNGTHMG